MQLKKVLGFLEFTNNFRITQRAIYAVGDDRNENDVEHSFQLAVFAWYLIDTLKLKLDSSLVIKYALLHDMDETFDGDVHIFDTKGRIGKEERAAKAREKIAEMFPHWEGYKNLVKKYETLGDEESRFVYALDKVLPVMNIMIDGGRSWHREVTTMQMLIENKRKKVTAHPVAQELWEHIEVYLTAHELELFGKLS